MEKMLSSVKIVKAANLDSVYRTATLRQQNWFYKGMLPEGACEKDGQMPLTKRGLAVGLNAVSIVTPTLDAWANESNDGKL